MCSSVRSSSLFSLILYVSQLEIQFKSPKKYNCHKQWHGCIFLHRTKLYIQTTFFSVCLVSLNEKEYQFFLCHALSVFVYHICMQHNIEKWFECWLYLFI